MLTHLKRHHGRRQSLIIVVVVVIDPPRLLLEEPPPLRGRELLVQREKLRRAGVVDRQSLGSEGGHNTFQ